MLCFRTFPVAKKTLDKRGVLGFSVEKFLSYRAKKYRRGILQCVTNFGYGNFFCFRGLSRFSVESFLFFVSQYRKISVEEHFCAVFEKSSGSEKDYE